MKLVQRCRFKTNDVASVAGVDSLFDYEYMGAAEYEFGALQGSLKAIVHGRDGYAIVDTGHQFPDGAKLMVYRRKDAEHEVRTTIADIISRSVRVKEGSHLPEILAGDKSSFYRAEAWWCLDDDWIAFRGENLGRLVVAAIEAVAKKWAAKSAA